MSEEHVSSTTPQSRGRRLLRTARASARDVIILVLGILIAFALDAWWDGRRETAREAVYVGELHREFSQNVERLETVLETNATAIDVANGLADMVAAGDPDVPREAFDAALEKAFRLQFFDPAVGTYTELRTGDGMPLIRDETLRAALAQWSVGIASLRRAEGYLTEQWMDDITAYFSKHVSLWAFLGQRAGTTMGYGDYDSADRPFEHDYDALIGNREFHNVVASRILYLGFLVSQNEALLETARTVVERTSP